MIAGIYARISLDRESDEKGVARQEADCRALAERMGLEVARVYVDNDVGASTRSGAKSRPQYAAMLEDARGGYLTHILGYSNSRLTRRPLELEDLIVLHEKYGVRVVTVASGADDLSTADGRMTARIKASVDAAEVERTSERLTRRHLQMALEGEPVGHRAFGWNDDGTLNPKEAAVARNLVDGCLAGTSLRRLAASLNGAGVKTSQGNDWSYRTVRQYLKNPRLCGWRTRHREILRDSSGKPVQGRWEPLVGADTWEALQERLGGLDGSRRVQRKGARRYFLSGIVRCGICGGPMSGNRRGGHTYYRCNDNGHALSIAGGPLDRMVEELLLRHLASTSLPTQAEWPDMYLLEEVEGRIDSTMQAFTKGELSQALAFPMLQRLEEQRADMQKGRTQWLQRTTGPALDSLTRREWDALPVEGRRAIAERLLEAVLVKPKGRQGRAFDPSRAAPVWKQ